jgi:hypothetical protein
MTLTDHLNTKQIRAFRIFQNAAILSMQIAHQNKDLEGINWQWVKQLMNYHPDEAKQAIVQLEKEIDLVTSTNGDPEFVIAASYNLWVIGKLIERNIPADGT